MSQIPLSQKLFVNSLTPLSCVFAALGIWQSKRKIEKEDLLNRIKIQNASGKIFSLTDEKLRDVEIQKKLNYYKIAVRGRFDHSREILIKPRSLITQETPDQYTTNDTFSTKNFIRSSNAPVYGAFVITPFILEKSKEETSTSTNTNINTLYTILINRGYINDSNLYQTSRDSRSFPQGPISLFGVFRKEGDRSSKKISKYVNENGEQYTFTSFKHHGNICDYLTKNLKSNNNNVNNVDVDDNHSTSSQEILLPICIDEDELSPNKNYDIEGTPVGNQTQLDLPNNHLGYVLQWFGFALAVLYIKRSRFGKGTQYYKMLQLEKSKKKSS